MCKRILYLDVLRIMAIFAVITIHVSYQFFPKQLTIDWYVSCAYDSLCRWCVPVFCMISGALFLDKKKVVPLKVLYRKHILRIVLAFVFWSILYAIFSPLINANNLNIRSFCGDVVQGHYHLWFLYMICGLYMSFPILKHIFRNGKILKYYMFVCLVFAFVIPFIFDISTSFGFIENFVGKVESGYQNMYLDFFSCFVFYFLLGGFISANDITHTQNNYLCIRRFCFNTCFFSNVF